VRAGPQTGPSLKPGTLDLGMCWDSRSTSLVFDQYRWHSESYISSGQDQRFLAGGGF
jgi:hypothetical protein